tara:strand:- start:138 stop:413 length:276 start_codon:yes stop_codon:yes gene_type:complete
MTWWNIIKISRDAKERIMDRYKSKTGSNPKGRVKGKGKDVSRRSMNCDMCGQKKALRAIKYYPPMKALCNSCAKFKYGPDYKKHANKIEDE